MQRLVRHKSSKFMFATGFCIHGGCTVYSTMCIDVEPMLRYSYNRQAEIKSNFYSFLDKNAFPVTVLFFLFFDIFNEINIFYPQNAKVLQIKFKLYVIPQRKHPANNIHPCIIYISRKKNIFHNRSLNIRRKSK